MIRQKVLIVQKDFSLVFKFVTIRIILTIALSSNMVVRQLDINNTFLNGKLEEENYITQNSGFMDLEYFHYMCKLKKALYELKQGPRTWFMKLGKCLQEMGFHSSNFDVFMLVNKQGSVFIIVLVYVDGI